MIGYVRSLNVKLAKRIEVVLRPHIDEEEATEAVVNDRRRLAELYNEYKHTMDFHAAAIAARRKIVSEIILGATDDSLVV